MAHFTWPVALVFFGGLVSVACGAAAAAFRNGARGNSRWPEALVVIGGLSSIVCGAVSALLQEGERNRSAIVQAEHDRALREKAEEIARLNHELAALVTGGDSFPLVVPARGDESRLTVFTMGKHPLYDLTITISDTRKFQELGVSDPRRSDEALGFNSLHELGTVPPGTGKMFRGPAIAKGATAVSLAVYPFSRNGSFEEWLRLERVNGKWVVAIRVFKLGERGSQEQVHEQVDVDFPRLPNSEIDW